MKLIIQNIATEYTDEGSGPVILCLHGWKDSLHTFDSLKAALLKKGRVVALDLPGFGETSNPPEAWQVNDYVQFVADFLQKMNVEVDFMVGHSFGGRVIIKGIGEGKLRAQKVVLIAAAGIVPEKTWRSRLVAIISQVASVFFRIPPFHFLRNKIRAVFYKKIGSDYLNAGALQETFVKIIAEDLSDYARRITIPTLLIWGKHDKATPVATAEKLHTLIVGSRLEVFPDAAHFVHHEKEVEVGALIEGFL